MIRLLVVRNDKLGDFMLSWPVFAMIKLHWPQAYISVLVPPYTEEMARLCPWIDEVVLDEGEGAFILARKLRTQRFNAMLTLFSTGRIALAGWLARIPYRLAPATKLAQFFYNHRLLQRRSRSEKPEYAYNLDLAYQLLADFDKLELRQCFADSLDDYLPDEIKRPLLKAASSQTRSAIAAVHQLNENKRWVIIHPGSGGSANNLTTQQYAHLALALTSKQPLSFIISAGPGEEKLGAKVAESIRLGGGEAQVIKPQVSLSDLVTTLQWADLFISGSTGPLHIASALDRPTAAFYPRHRSATPLRWQTLNAPQKRLAFVPPEGEDPKQLANIDIALAARKISEQLLAD